MINCKNIEISIHLEACNEDNIYLFDKDKLVQKLEQLGYVETFAFIYHDEELDKGITNHIHLMLQFKQTMSLDRLEKDFALPNQCFEKIKGRWCNAIAYLTHSNKLEKHQYGFDKVVSNIDVERVTNEALSVNSKKQEIENLLYAYGKCEITKSKLFATLDASDFHQYNALYKHMVEYRQMKVRDRNMKVMYICGESGSGKTTLAKFFAVTNNYDYFVSGSGKDVLDGYDKEECIILDDLRADAFTKGELFKLCDNNTNSSVKSRFHNKDISFCKLLIITSVKTPLELYNWETLSFENSNESFKQFSRRLGNMFFMINPLAEVVAIKLEPTPFDETEWRQGEKLKSPITMASVYSYFQITRGVDTILGDILSNAIKESEKYKDGK
jgi:DNA-binding Lrp family transcriptional regulator